MTHGAHGLTAFVKRSEALRCAQMFASLSLAPDLLSSQIRNAAFGSQHAVSTLTSSPCPEPGTQRLSAVGPQRLCLPQSPPHTPPVCVLLHIPRSLFTLPFMWLAPHGNLTCKDSTMYDQGGCKGQNKKKKNHRFMSRPHSPGPAQTRPWSPQSCTGRTQQRNERRHGQGPRSRDRWPVQRGVY